MDVAARIKKIRKERRIPQTELARAIGVSHTAIQKYEAGRMPLTAAKLADIASALDVPAARLFGEDDHQARFRGTAGEHAWQSLYRRLSPDQQVMIFALLRSFIPDAD